MSDYEHPYNALPQGYRLQEYELVRVLGAGGFGITYLGFDDNRNRAVAIKEYLPSDLAARTTNGSVVPQASTVRDDFQWGLDRFLDEARTLARFDHRHIIKVHRFFEAHGTAYIVMEYVEGETLSDYLEREGSLSEAKLKEILYPLLDGLEEVHGAGILHRDITPANIVIRAEDDSPVLIDFGAARQEVDYRLLTTLNPAYAPIEQYSSEGNQGAWTDLYELGGVCYRALTGDVPVVATDRVRDDLLVPVSQRCAGQASAGFLSAMDAALSVSAEDRPQSVAAWRKMLEADGEEEARLAAEQVEIQTDSIESLGFLEILGMTDSPQEVQDEILSKAVSIVETRALTEILKQLDAAEQETLADLFEAGDNEKLNSFLAEKNIDLATLLEKETVKLKQEYAEKFRTLR